MIVYLKQKKWFVLGNIFFLPAFVLSSPFNIVFASCGFATLFMAIYIEEKKARLKRQNASEIN